MMPKNVKFEHTLSLYLIQGWKTDKCKHTNRGQCSHDREQQTTGTEYHGRCCEIAFCRSHAAWLVHLVAGAAAIQRRWI